MKILAVLAMVPMVICAVKALLSWWMCGTIGPCRDPWHFAGAVLAGTIPVVLFIWGGHTLGWW